MIKHMSKSRSEIQDTCATAHVFGGDVGIYITTLLSFSSETNNILCCFHCPKTIEPIGNVCPFCVEYRKYKVPNYVSVSVAEKMKLKTECALESLGYLYSCNTTVLSKVNILQKKWSSSALLLEKHLRTSFMFVLFGSLKTALYLIHDGSCARKK
jgi:hypothetical protein